VEVSKLLVKGAEVDVLELVYSAWVKEVYTLVPPIGVAAKTSNLTSVPAEPELYKFLLTLELYFNPTILIRSVDIFKKVAILSMKLV
jgi:hypothetical protein